MAPFPGTLPLVGRTLELDSLVELLRRAREARARSLSSRVRLGSGRRGCWPKHLTEREGFGFQPFIGAAAELERERPFGALVEALIFTHSVGSERAEIGQLLVADRDPVEGSRLSLGEAPALRFRVLEAVLTLVERLCLSAPMAIAVEDLHWADPSTLLVLRQLCRPCPRAARADRDAQTLALEPGAGPAAGRVCCSWRSSSPPREHGPRGRRRSGHRGRGNTLARRFSKQSRAPEATRYM